MFTVMQRSQCSSVVLCNVVVVVFEVVKGSWEAILSVFRTNRILRFEMMKGGRSYNNT